MSARRAAGPRISRERIVRGLRQAAVKGDRSALALAVDQMRTLALSPRYWERYLRLLRSPLARLVDLLVIKQGDRIAHQKGWKLAGASPPVARTPGPAGDRRRSPRTGRAPSVAGPVRGRPAAVQHSLFD